ncbi:MAG: alpha/beta hydrolase [Anaerolineae bacterium]|nr:alpha/beta hydrolase [Anaerolineae bacterium]
MSASPESQAPVKFVRLPSGRNLAYAEYGDPAGKPVIFIQGTPSSRLMHPDDTITAAAGARLIAIDRPGFGLSDFAPGRRLLDWPDDILAVADSLGFERFAVVGISGGGPYTAACAYKIPDRLTVAAIVAGAGPLDTPDAGKGMTRMRRIGLTIAQRAPWLLVPVLWFTTNPSRNPARFMERFSGGLCPADRAIMDRPHIKAMFLASYAESTRRGVRGLAHELRLFAQPWRFRLEDIKTPVVIWHGDQDASTPISLARHMASHIPGCEITIFPGEGHLFLFDRWQVLLDVLLNTNT